MKWFVSLIFTLFSMVSFAEVLWIDVRTQGEFNGGHVSVAHNIPYGDIAKRIHELSTDKSQEILLYCRSGRRASVALKTLTSMGYKNVKNVGGYDDAVEYRKNHTPD